MKKNFLKKVLSVAIVATMTLGLAACGGSEQAGTPAGADSSTNVEAGVEDTADTVANLASDKGGTIMWMASHEDKAIRAGFEALCDSLGYKSVVVYGDGFNDAAGNLSAVRNSMTSDVVALITSQDGGIKDIMEEYPDLYVAGCLSDMNSVYADGGENAAVLSNDHYLGTICDGYADGADMAQTFFDVVKENGYHKIALVNFPSYAYPNQGVIDAAFKEKVAEYNATVSAEEAIELVGETTTLEFSVLNDSWFLEEGHDSLDCIVGICSGTSFIYPTLLTAKANGICSMDTKLITVGFEEDPSFLDDIGGDGTIGWLAVASPEPMAYCMALIDNALNGTQYADWTNARIDSSMYIIDSPEDAAQVKEKSVNVTYDPKDLPISAEVLAQYITRINPEATYASLMELLQNPEYTSVDALYNR